MSGEVAIGVDGEVLFEAVGDFEAVDVSDGGAEFFHELVVVEGFFEVGGFRFFCHVRFAAEADVLCFGTGDEEGGLGAVGCDVVFFQLGDGSGEEVDVFVRRLGVGDSLAGDFADE
ncbi:MAG: hypothetical protein AABZ08_01695 [Planctomycetota bacterium]